MKLILVGATEWYQDGVYTLCTRDDYYLHGMKSLKTLTNLSRIENILYF